MKRNVLFVDDDTNVLQGLRRMLRPMRVSSDWAMPPLASVTSIHEVTNKPGRTGTTKPMNVCLSSGVEAVPTTSTSRVTWAVMVSTTPEATHYQITAEANIFFGNI